MNGDSYSSRGMGSASALPRIRKHETDSSHSNAADPGRYGPSRDYYVSNNIEYCLNCDMLIVSLRAREMTAAIETQETGITTVAEIDGAQGPLDTETHAHPVAIWK